MALKVSQAFHYKVLSDRDRHYEKSVPGDCIGQSVRFQKPSLYSYDVATSLARKKNRIMYFLRRFLKECKEEAETSAAAEAERELRAAAEQEDAKNKISGRKRAKPEELLDYCKATPFCFSPGGAFRGQGANSDRRLWIDDAFSD
ncbi:hypothetical protein F5883DRAFT_719949 [Diaporthe sp. PMI_573]|nr:hypothetical protein F5883DRAFT_719949 [Diaporthaceae sp. PMI_573]